MAFIEKSCLPWTKGYSSDLLCLPDVDCSACGHKSCLEFAEAVLEKTIDPHLCPDLDPSSADLLKTVAGLRTDPIPYNLIKPVMVIPGLAEKEKNSIRQITRWEVLVGPVSGFMLPLFVLKNGDLFRL